MTFRDRLLAAVNAYEGYDGLGNEWGPDEAEQVTDHLLAALGLDDDALRYLWCAVDYTVEFKDVVRPRWLGGDTGPTAMSAPDPFSIDPAWFEGECWVCGKWTSNLYSTLATQPGDVGMSWCEECHVFGETQPVEAQRDRLRDRVVALMRERSGDAGASSVTTASVGQSFGGSPVEDP